MKRLAKLSLIAILLAATGRLPAQENTQAILRRTIPVTVLDRQGKPVGGLTPQNLRGEFAGQPVKIRSITWDSQPRRIVVLLDVSMSMSWGDKWMLARKGVEDIMVHARPQDQIAVLLFGDRIVERIEFGQAGPAALARLNSVPTRLDELNKKPMRTALHDALIEALHTLEPARRGDLIYVITDGGDNASKLTIDKLKKTLACAGVRTFFLLLFDPDHAGRGPEYRLGPYLGEDLAELTGGGTAMVSLFTDREAIGAAARSLYGQMVEFYSVEIELGRPIDKQRRWSLKAVDEQGKKLPGVTVAYPHQLAPCSATPAGAQ